MADKCNQMFLDALTRAGANPAGLPLLGGKAAPGLFAPSARLAAQQCKDAGYLRVVRTESRGKTLHEVCALTDKGLAFLLSQADPQQLLEDLVRALEGRHRQLDELLAVARQTQADLEALKTTAERTMQLLHPPAPTSNGAPSWLDAVLGFLAQRRAAGAIDDCPLPELFRHAGRAATSLTIGQFHDGLRRLLEQQRIYLHPWTGPLYDLPEPALALLVGHEIAYYAAIR